MTDTKSDIAAMPWVEIEKLCEASDAASALLTEIRKGARREQALDVMPQGMGHAEQRALREATLSVRRSMGRLAALNQSASDELLRAELEQIKSHNALLHRADDAKVARIEALEASLAEAREAARKSTVMLGYILKRAKWQSDEDLEQLRINCGRIRGWADAAVETLKGTTDG